MPAPAHIQAATLNTYIEGWRKLSPDEMTSTFSQDYQLRLLPASLGLPAQSLVEVKAFLPKLASALSNHKLEVFGVVHEAAKSRAVIYAAGTADTPFEDCQWRNECAVFVTFTEDGLQISKMEEMVDSNFHHDFFARFGQHMRA